MKKALCTVLILLQFAFVSCNGLPDSRIPTESFDTALVSPTHHPPSENNQSAETIETVPYPNPQSVSAYETLTDDQKMAYDAIEDALYRAINGSFPVGWRYRLERRISWYDFMLAYKIIAANYTALEEILTNFFAQDSLGTQEYANEILFFDDGFVSDFCRVEYPKLCKAADDILNSLTYDGTEPGKAFAIAKWLVDNVAYPSDYKQRSSDSWLISASGPILKKEAVGDGYAKAYDFLCKKAGLQTIYVISFKQMHAWNMICIDNVWYHIDTAWMQGSDSFRNFMMSDKECYRFHEEAEYYSIPRTLEKIIPEAPYYSSYGRFVFDTADDAFDYLFQNKLPDNSLLCFSSADEKQNFLDYNHKYISTYDSYLSVGSLSDDIAVISYQ